MFNQGNKLIIKKGYFDFESFYGEYKKDELNQCVIHFRIKTHGVIDEVNCHPFIVTPNLAFIHNGIVSGFGTATHSDTYMFNEEILKPMIKRFGKKIFQDQAFKLLTEGCIGYSKLVFLDNYGHYEIYNEDRGDWVGNVWYSNTSYIVPKVYVPTAYSCKKTILH